MSLFSIVRQGPRPVSSVDTANGLLQQSRGTSLLITSRRGHTEQKQPGFVQPLK